MGIGWWRVKVEPCGCAECKDYAYVAQKLREVEAKFFQDKERLAQSERELHEWVGQQWEQRGMPGMTAEELGQKVNRGERRTNGYGKA